LNYGAYVNYVGAPTLATNNVMSLFGPHRRLLRALLDHLAAYEMTSSVPNRAYGTGLRRLGADPSATCLYDEHVEATPCTNKSPLAMAGERHGGADGWRAVRPSREGVTPGGPRRP
jgi:hypothetical protein